VTATYRRTGKKELRGTLEASGEFQSWLLDTCEEGDLLLVKKEGGLRVENKRAKQVFVFGAETKPEVLRSKKISS